MKAKKTAKAKKVPKTKKALRKLDRVADLLARVIEQYPADELGVRELLDSARASVIQAKVKAKLATGAASPGKGKSPSKAKSTAPAMAKPARKAKPGISRGTARAARAAASEGTSARLSSVAVADDQRV